MYKRAPLAENGSTKIIECKAMSNGTWRKRGFSSLQSGQRLAYYLFQSQLPLAKMVWMLHLQDQSLFLVKESRPSVKFWTVWEFSWEQYERSSGANLQETNNKGAIKCFRNSKKIRKSRRSEIKGMEDSFAQREGPTYTPGGF